MMSCILMPEGVRYSVLMSVYGRETADHLRTAMESIWNQTLCTDDFVLICDGPLSEELDSVIAKMQAGHPELHVVWLKKNAGLGPALNEGLTYCRNELVARMDSDDISCPDRCECQIRAFLAHPEVSVISGTVEEFSVSPDMPEASRVLPERHEEIVSFARRRNPFNHPCVMYKKSAVISAGGYLDFYLLEDYDLWIRMLAKGFRGYNLQQTLLMMRAGSRLYLRRSGWKYAKSQAALFRRMKERGFITYREYLSSTVTRTVVSMLPNALRKKLFYKAVR